MTFSDDKKGNIIGVGKVAKSPSQINDDVMLVHGLKHNLRSISQLCDKGTKLSLLFFHVI